VGAIVGLAVGLDGCGVGERVGLVGSRVGSGVGWLGRYEGAVEGPHDGSREGAGVGMGEGWVGLLVGGIDGKKSTMLMAAKDAADPATAAVPLHKSSPPQPSRRTYV
jgi:hypothetical protein